MLVCQFLKGFYLQLHNYTGASDWDKSFTLTCKDDKDTIVDTAIMTSESTRLHWHENRVSESRGWPLRSLKNRKSTGYVVLTMFCKRGRRKAKDGRWKQNFRKNFVLCKYVGFELVCALSFGRHVLIRPQALLASVCAVQHTPHPISSILASWLVHAGNKQQDLMLCL